MSSWRDYIPVSRNWLNKLEALNASDAFQGKLGKYGTVIAHPFWARTLENVLPATMFNIVERVIPDVRKTKLGNAPMSEKTSRHRYYTAAWSTYPCSCQYRYAGFSKQKIGIIGSPADYPLCKTVAEACSIT